MGDHSHLPWEEAPDWQRKSCIKGVEGALAGATPRQSHESWLTAKAAEGWTWGPVKNPAEKKHPCFLPYDELPPAQRIKDELYLTVVRAVASALGEDVQYDPLEARKLVEALRAIVSADSTSAMHDAAASAAHLLGV
jgi:hypothetical protein